MKPIKTYWIDLFCGAGGTTTGIHLSDVDAEVLVCVNHDAEAIKCHKKNHPRCLHFTEDVRDFEVVRKIAAIVKAKRAEEPNCIINIWASLECTHFSKAKGGLSRDADSRTLAAHLYKYVEQLDPDYIYIENVREFLSWGPLYQVSEKKDGVIQFKAVYDRTTPELKKINKGKPKHLFTKIEHEKNRYYYKRRNIRPFLLPIKERSAEFYNEWKRSIEFYGYDYDYRMMNSADYGAYTSRDRYFGVFARKGMPISFPEPTHQKRSNKPKKGLKFWKPVREVLDLFNEGQSIFGLNNNGKPYSENTLKRIYAGLLKFANEGLFIKRYNGGDPTHKTTSVNEPLGTILTNRTHAVIKPCFLTSYYGNGQPHSVDEPCNTLTTKERFAAHFINYDYSNPTHTSIEDPAGSITTVPKHNFVTANWLVDTQYKNTGRNIEKPAQTLIARMDKKPIYLISASDKISVFDEIRDFRNETERLIFEFMEAHGIADIKIRMLTVDELKKIQGFPNDFELTGTKTNQLKFIGNSVVPIMAKALIESNHNAAVHYINEKLKMSA